jgi:hypothetical protein
VLAAGAAAGEQGQAPAGAGADGGAPPAPWSSSCGVRFAV